MRFSIACSIILCLAAHPAAAGRLGVVVRGAAAGSDRAATFVSHAMTQQLQADSRHELALPEAALGGSQREAAERAFVVAGELMDRAAAAYEELELDAAVELLQTAVDKYEQHCAYLSSTSDVIKGLTRLAAMCLLRSEENEARETLRRAFALDGGLEPEARMFNPGMRKIFYEMRAAVSQLPTGALALASTPSYAEIYVDGAFAGVTPVTIDGLTEGRHFVRLVKDGYLAAGHMVETRGGQETSATLRLSPTKRFDDFDALADQAVAQASVDAMDQLGVLLNLDVLLLGRVSLDGERIELRSTLYDLNARKALAQHVQSFGYSLQPKAYDEVIRGHLQLLLHDVAPGPSKPPQVAAAPKSEPKPAAPCTGAGCGRGKVIAVTLALTGGVIGMGVGGVMWGLAKSDNDAYRSSAQTSPETQELLDSGQTKALVGDILFGVGAVAVTVGAILIFTWDPAPDPSTDVAAGNDPFALVPWIGPSGAGLSLRTVF